MCGLAATGLLYVALSLLVRIKGSAFLERFLPRVVTGPAIMTWAALWAIALSFIGNFALAGIGLAAVVGVLLNLLLPRGTDERAAD